MSTVLPSYYVELIDGVAIEKAVPKHLHAIIQAFLIQWFARTISSRTHDILPELNVICGADRLIPDVTIARLNARFVDGDLAEPPQLAVEILSPGQTLADLMDKCNRLLRTGTQICWVIWPEKRRAWNYSLADLEEVGASGGSSLLQYRFVDERNNELMESLPVVELWGALERRGL